MYILESTKKIENMAMSLEDNCENTLKTVHDKKSQVGIMQEDDGFGLLLDPANSPKIIQNSVYRQKLNCYPENRNISKNKQRMFSSMWYKENPHLEYSVKADYASCFVCALFPSGPGRKKSQMLG